MKKIFLLTIAFICLLLAGCSNSGDYKECSYIKADNVELYSSESTMKLVRLVCDLSDINELYIDYRAVSSITNKNDGKITYNGNVYMVDGEVGEIYISKTFIKYNETMKKAVEITEKNANKSLTKGVYEAIIDKKIYLPLDFLWMYPGYDNNNYQYTDRATKLEYSKIESNYDLSGSSSIQYVYA